MYLVSVLGFQVIKKDLLLDFDAVFIILTPFSDPPAPPSPIWVPSPWLLTEAQNLHVPYVNLNYIFYQARRYYKVILLRQS